MRSLVFALLIVTLFSCKYDNSSKRPNIIFIMADDLGWGDTGFNGNNKVKTPFLDSLSAQGIRFSRFYAASPVCSPTRASCLTGRNPYRMNIITANHGFMKTEEVTLAEILRNHKYNTGHFGKWHLGTMTTKVRDSNRGRKDNYADFSIPSQHGFQHFFSTEAKVPTYDPMIRPKMYDEKVGETPRYGWKNVEDPDSAEAFGTHYWEGKEIRTPATLQGDDSEIIVDQALQFIRNRKDSLDPFFAVVWLHTPHLPVVTDQEHMALYPESNFKEQLYYGAISAMDEQIGRLWNSLEAMGIQNETLIWFCSDNGPESGTPGSSGKFRQRKRSLFEGGVRVPSFIVWKNNISSGQNTDFPVVTSDMMPTIMDLLDIRHPLSRPLDGISIKSVLEGKDKSRSKPIGFLYGTQMSWVNHQYKLISEDKGSTYQLYDLHLDPIEKNNIISENSAISKIMINELTFWRNSVDNSRYGGDY